MCHKKFVIKWFNKLKHKSYRICNTKITKCFFNITGKFNLLVSDIEKVTDFIVKFIYTRSFARYLGSWSSLKACLFWIPGSSISSTCVVSTKTIIIQLHLSE